MKLEYTSSMFHVKHLRQCFLNRLFLCKSLEIREGIQPREDSGFPVQLCPVPDPQQLLGGHAKGH